MTFKFEYIKVFEDIVTEIVVQFCKLWNFGFFIVRLLCYSRSENGKCNCKDVMPKTEKPYLTSHFKYGDYLKELQIF